MQMAPGESRGQYSWPPLQNPEICKTKTKPGGGERGEGLEESRTLGPSTKGSAGFGSRRTTRPGVRRPICSDSTQRTDLITSVSLVQKEEKKPAEFSEY